MLRLLAQIKINRVFSVLSRLYLAKSKHRVCGAVLFTYMEIIAKAKSQSRRTSGRESLLDLTVAFFRQQYRPQSYKNKVTESTNLYHRTLSKASLTLATAPFPLTASFLGP